MTIPRFWGVGHEAPNVSGKEMRPGRLLFALALFVAMLIGRAPSASRFPDVSRRLESTSAHAGRRL